MASSPQLASSVPDPGENPSPSTHGQQVPASHLPMQPSVSSPAESEKRAPASDIPIASPSQDVFAVLRRSIADETQPPEALIRATTEAAKVLTAADGVAIAFRNKGVIVCRSRSGDVAPDLGSYVNANSGISGECLRTASILVCQDARSDTRVDNLVCERMGIRSIVVVPLRGPVGMSGILEVFSTRVNAFGNREINSLRGLAEIAEAAYERERRIQQEGIRTALRSAHRLPAVFQRSNANEGESWGAPQDLSEFRTETTEHRPERLVWAVAIAIIALLMILGVWLSWHGPISELAELEAAKSHSTVQAAPRPQESIPWPKPVAGIVRLENQNRHAKITKGSSARSLQAEADSPLLVLPRANRISNAANSALPSPAPAVEISTPTNRPEFASLLASQAELPVMEGTASPGLVPGELIRRVDPVYPLQARAQRISGKVVLEVRIGQDGMVRNVKSISGDPQLASAAVQAVRQWRYAPTLLDGHPIETTTQVTVLFKLP